MNAPTHFVASTVVAFGLLKVAGRGGRLTRKRTVACAVLAVLASASLHLVLDVAPHYAWIYYLDPIIAWEHDWILRESVFSLVVVLPGLYWAAPHRVVVCLGMLGGVYPDIEKALKLNYFLMKDEVLFATHSHMGSCNDYGLWKPGLIAGELVLIGVLMVLAYQWSPRMREINRTPPPPAA